jgi:hypothetical protein
MVELKMSNQSKKNTNQLHISIDDIISGAIENAEARRNVSNEEMDGINGGLPSGGATTGARPVKPPVVITMGKIKTDDNYC